MAVEKGIRQRLTTQIQQDIILRPRNAGVIAHVGQDLTLEDAVWESGLVDLGLGEIWGMAIINIESISFGASGAGCFKWAIFGSNEQETDRTLLGSILGVRAGSLPSFSPDTFDLEVGQHIMPFTNGGRNSGELFRFVKMYLLGFNSLQGTISFNSYISKHSIQDLSR